MLEAGFLLDEEANIVSCSICPDVSVSGQFFYDTDIGVDFSECEMPREFRNLKRSALRHIAATKSHMDVLVEKEQKLKAETELKSKNNVIGMNLGRLCMKNYLFLGKRNLLI